MYNIISCQFKCPLHYGCLFAFKLNNSNQSIAGESLAGLSLTPWLKIDVFNFRDINFAM